MGKLGERGDPPVAAVRRGLRALALVLALGLAAACGGGGGEGNAEEADRAEDAEAEDAPAEWVRVGLDLANTRAMTAETEIDPDTVAGLRPAWDVRGLRGVSGTPLVSGGTVWFGDWTGHVRALDAATGDELWAQDLHNNYIGGSLVLDGDRVYAGTFDGRVVALDRETGEPVWETPIGDHPKAVIFGSPVVADGLVVTGVGSFEVFVPGDPPTFRGHVVALDAESGAEVWRFWLTRGDATEAAGVSIWSSPAVDEERGVLYIGTGQAYAQPAPPRSDALLALDLRTGAEVWTTQFTAGDAWTITQPTGLDADVGAVPNLFRVGDVDAVGVGDKAGTYRALDRDTGEILWERPLTQGGTQGGVMASAAVSGGTLYVTSNDASRDADLVAIDAGTGEEVWRVPVGAHVTGPVTWANGVLYVSDDSGRIAAYDAAGGSRLWAYDVPFPAAGGVAVVDGTVYAGWGWWLAGSPPDADGGLLAFSLDGGGGGDPGDAGGGERGRTIYQQSCAACHGGAGEGASGPSLAGVAGRLTVEDHLAVVRDGRGNMPGWEGTLSAEEIEAVVEYERTVLSGG
ncbi:MAG TPA: PQQ-binding-like beta-propeller repeat protein [Acidimicrobiales bacterium]|nr:PQQ-binding-like beta-propeller repeat protein [Acidimicrobiales bacterium]